MRTEIEERAKLLKSMIYNILLYFLIYSCLGWAVEVAYQALSKGLVINRGFLNGPVCPIYGCGVVAILALLYSVSGGHPENVNAVGVFVIGIILATVIELFGGWALDKLFHARWWDYRDRKFNLNGYICPEFSVYWGLGIVLLIKVVHPFIEDVINMIPMTIVSWIVAFALYAIFIADIITSGAIMIGLNKRFAEIDELQRRMRVVSDRVSTKIGEEALEGKEKVEYAKLEVALGKAELNDEVDKIYDKLIKHRFFGVGRVLFHNPTFTHSRYGHVIEEIKGRAGKGGLYVRGRH